MLVYSRSRQEFNNDILSNKIEEKILKSFQTQTGRTTSPNEIRSWRNSLQYMNNVLLDADVPYDAGVSIEYKIPQSSKRIDFILTGKDKSKRDTAVIVELKQWERANLTPKDGVVSTYVAGGEREVEHPSYQAWTYAALLEDFNETIRNESIQLQPCAFLHNCESDDVINNKFYGEYTEKAPSFLKNDAQDLARFIKQFVKYGDANKIMYRIEKGKISPSKNLADKLASLLEGNQEFLMIDEQKLVYETSLHMARTATPDNKQVLIVEGGPGTGKSVVAINLLVEITNNKGLVQYVTKNAAPRAVYESRLTGTYKKSRISNMFKGSGAYHSVDPNTFEALIVDEAHRLNEKTGMFQNLGENQVKEIIDAAKHSIFFIDEDQRVTFKDIGHKAEIHKWAKKLGATVTEMKLSSQFRCNGSNAYLAWLDSCLQIHETANTDISDLNYTVEVFDDPNDLRDTIYRKNKKKNRARIVAGYCWDWVTKKKSSKHLSDIVISEYDFGMKWNLESDGNLWIDKPDSVTEVGCIHTCQGLELDYVGVIIGNDLLCREGVLTTNPDGRAKTDQSLKGYKKLFKSNPKEALDRADAIIRNTYRTLMTRGQKGCYIFCTDPETNAYFKRLVSSVATSEVDEEASAANGKDDTSENLYPGLHLPILEYSKVMPFENAVPLLNLKIAAGGFSETQSVEALDWVQLPEYFKHAKGYFVAQVVGESMNKRIPNGSWCLFKLNPSGSRQGKIIVAKHHSIYDEDHGGEYTIKKYESRKTYFDDGTWVHSEIRLKPETYTPGYADIVISENYASELVVIAEFMSVL